MHHDQPLHQLTHHADRLSDRELVTSVFDLLGSPPAADADSFVLHAPLELMARAELLPSVEPDRRADARQRILDIATEWAGRSPHVAVSAESPTLSLPAAIASGEPDEADRALVDLAARHTIGRFVAAAAGELLAHLGGAAHLGIFLDQLTRQHRPPQSAIRSGRALVRDLARRPDWTLRWFESPPADTRRAPTTFLDVLVAPPSAGDPGSNFIYPTMHLVDASGMAAELLAAPTRSLSTDEARRQLLRIAAMSMLQDDPANAPYGWSHCLTMPQAALAIAPRTADPRRAVAVAATYVLGFRATQSSTALDLDWRPAPTSAHGPLLEADVDDAVAQAWHANDPRDVERELATHAATHHDAHLAKYTLACFHAAHDDPDAAPLFRAAATRLAVWWRDHDQPTTDQGDDHHDQ
ncbi:MAG: hypothetical protein MUE78_02705 [Ilumatobacteraceae bacterium]|jgi:hypothetical protein|nr:hypothetical protein [Ilumatobacteraceae bacterium]